MRSLEAEDFEAFFNAIHGYPPFAWQSRLCRMVIDAGVWPESIGAPTGTGKSNVVDVHAFVNALYGWGSGPRVPRRLAVVVNRRGIVDAHEQRALELQQQLRHPTADVVVRVAEGLRRLQHESSSRGDVLALATLRGGLIPDRAWIDDPASCTIICATPDMWGSRILFGGYGSSPHAHPREAALLAFDSVMILDEAHLNRQLLTTARRVRDLLHRHPMPAPALQVVETTATPAGEAGARSIGVSPSDVETDATLARRLSRPKPVTYRATVLWPGKRPISSEYIAEVADAVIERRNSTLDGTVGCIVNTVTVAVQLARALKDRLAGEPTRNQVLSWVGPMRPLDLTKQVNRHPLAFRPEGDPDVGVIVATQTIEVGVDIDFAALVTELAPGAALAQRAGRVNRLGSRESGPIVVIGPAGEPERSGPYAAEELSKAREWLLQRAADPAGLTPLAAISSPAPAASAPRDVFGRLEPGDIEALATTSEDLAAAPERSLWLRDDLTPDRQECGIVLRSGLPVGDLDSLALLQVTPPAVRETFPVQIEVAREICRALDTKRSPRGRVFVWRDSVIRQMQLGEGEEPTPADVLILDSEHPIVCEHTIVAYGDGAEEPTTVWGAVDGNNEEVQVLWRADDPELFERIDAIVADPDCDVDDVQELVTEVLSDTRQVTVGPPFAGDENGEVPWLVLKPRRVIAEDEETRQTWGGGAVVALDAHSAAVAKRARSLAQHLSLADDEAATLELAGLHHDAGKRDARFQRVLGAKPGDTLRAKSGGASSRRAQVLKARAGLPPGWRHEQLSVVVAHRMLTDLDREQRDLVLRLVGTSHGRGRSAFPHSAGQLIDPQAPEHQPTAVEMFDCGGWDALIEATHRANGPWACAYFEALLRAADCTVSEEGS